MPERDFVLIFEPVDTKTHPTAQDMLGLRFRMALIWKEKREVGEVDTSLRLSLFLGLTKQFVRQITANLEQPEDLEQLAQLGLLRQPGRR